MVNIKVVLLNLDTEWIVHVYVTLLWNVQLFIGMYIIGNLLEFHVSFMQFVDYCAHPHEAGYSFEDCPG